MYYLMISDRRFAALSNSAGLIKDDAVKLAGLLEGFTPTFNEDPILSRETTTDKKDRRRCESDTTGARDNKN